MPLSDAPTATRPTSVRHRVVVMLFITIAINYLDRSNLSVAAPRLSADLGFDPVRMGIIFSAFGWAYCFLQIPGGWLVDRVNVRYLYAGTCLLWSVATLFQGIAGTFAALVALRVLLGIFEAPSFPMCSRIVTLWFPERERAGATATYIAGQFVGLAFLTVILAYIEKRFGWHAIFYATGGLGIIWAGIWLFLYRDPAHSDKANAAELEYIREGGGLVATAKSETAFHWEDFKVVLGSRKLWGVYIGQYAVTSTLWFFLTWFPTYLVQYRHIELIKAGYFSSVTFGSAFVGVLFSGFLSDLLVRRGISQTTARKVPIVLGLFLAGSIIGANFVDAPGLVLLFLSVAFFGTGCASITWVLVSLIAPGRLLGLTGGTFNFFGNLASFSIPYVIGVVVKYHGFTPAIGLISAIAVIGALSYIFVVGRIERIQA